RIERERRSDRRQQLRQRAAKERPGRLARTDRFERGRSQFAKRLRPAERFKKGSFVVARGAAREPPVDHRPMKRDHAASDRQERQDGGEIAVTNERLAGGSG